MTQDRKFIVQEHGGDKNYVKIVKTWFVIHTDTGGYTEDEVTFYLSEDGQIMVVGEREYGATLYREQQDVLLALIEAAKSLTQP